jgi:hypothetical protein
MQWSGARAQLGPLRSDLMLRSRHRVGIVVVILATVATMVVGAALASADTASNEAAAQSEAAAMLASLSLPPGATQSATEPAGDGGALATPVAGSLDPNYVDDSGWWTVPEPPAAVLAYLNSNPPAGATVSGGGASSGGGRPTETFVGFRWPTTGDAVNSSEMSVGVVALPDGSTALRADTAVVWVMTRPTSEVVPAGAQQLNVSVAGNGSTQKPLTVTSPAQIAAVVSLLNALPAAQPGPMLCPVTPDAIVTLKLYAAGATSPEADASFNPFGCSELALALNGQPQPQLEPPLMAQLDAALGLTLDIGPPVDRTPSPVPNPGPNPRPAPSPTPAPKPKGVLVAAVSAGGHVAHRPRLKPITGTARVFAAGHKLVAKQRVRAGHNARFRLAPGRYTLTGPTRDGCRPVAVVVRSGRTLRVNLNADCETRRR